jgi:LEA14-like dessication related protein
MRRIVFALGAAGAALAVASCATLKPPTLQVQKLSFGKVGVTGARMNVAFAVRNPNPEDLLIEKFEYELILNGRSLGRGYEAEPVAVKGFGQERVLSHFDLDFLKLPFGIKEIVDEKEARARARGTFYVRRGPGQSLEKMGFDSEAQVDLQRD